jgi:protein PhnA
MKLKRTPDLLTFLSTGLPDEADLQADEAAARKFADASTPERRKSISSQIQGLLSDPELPVEEFGTEGNRWFGDADEARAWLTQMHGVFQGGESAETGAGRAVKDSNGAVLSEGDSVQVIKDLKVRGGSSDLKRGTLIKKIHLIDDAENIECRVDGSTLVLKTCFLKKA